MVPRGFREGSAMVWQMDDVTGGGRGKRGPSARRADRSRKCRQQSAREEGRIECPPKTSLPVNSQKYD